jgi:hypothetical protein
MLPIARSAVTGPTHCRSCGTAGSLFWYRGQLHPTCCGADSVVRDRTDRARPGPTRPPCHRCRRPGAVPATKIQEGPRLYAIMAHKMPSRLICSYSAVTGGEAPAGASVTRVPDGDFGSKWAVGCLPRGNRGTVRRRLDPRLPDSGRCLTRSHGGGAGRSISRGSLAACFGLPPRAGPETRGQALRRADPGRPRLACAWLSADPCIQSTSDGHRG